MAGDGRLRGLAFSCLLADLQDALIRLLRHGRGSATVLNRFRRLQKENDTQYRVGYMRVLGTTYIHSQLNDHLGWERDELGLMAL
jgi:hypothetical protein